MTVHNRLQDPSLRFLLWLEWLLLGLSALGEFSQRIQLFPDRAPLLSFLCIGLLGILGRHLPSQLRQKIGYIAINLTLVLIASVIGQIQFFFVLCIVLMLRSCLLFERTGRWLMIAALISFFITVQTYRWQTIGNHQILQNLKQVRPILAGSIVLFSLTLIFLHLLMNALLAERHSRQQLATANAQLRDYAMQVEQVATLQERTRVAREIHDAIGHSLTALHLNLNAAAGLWSAEPQQAKTLLDEATALSQVALKEIRTSIAALRSDPLQGKALTNLIQNLITQLEQTTSITANVNINLPPNLPEAQKTTTYRITQEAITNIIKHAEATVVDIQLQSDRQHLQLLIQDNGQGFDQQENTSGFGLRGMNERILALGGNLTIDSTIGNGCRIQMQLPLSQAQI
ncbi:sensor histidine kinase [filamentous cyanobacterium LEGE 11480]|uniref:histidine kinase n=1 Tax=Romeriopsis navalis LEGE 11480 TaxID=2777977 RepID=A0A928Z222_9CYAN|nr:sensor histidine kinase [Romeriopsis navalis]MBE9029089.1 sensor histidine kinase [Romeriopsis navalis LEGE 11480]